MTRRRFALSILLTFPIAIRLPAQGKKKTYTLRGKVESVDAAAKSMSVNHGKVEGWMEAMTMNYQVDNADAFKSVKVGDTIEATVYEGDYKLYKVHIVAPDQKK